MPSPEYVAWNAKLPDTSGVCANVVPSATPAASSVNGADVAAGVPTQTPLVNHENVTVPVGVPSPPVTVAWSCTSVPAGTDVTTSCAASWITVAVLDATGVTVNGSHGPVEAVYVPSPEYDAWNAKLPPRDRRLREPGGVRHTAASSGNGADVAAAGAVQAPLVNHENVTVPVGVPRRTGDGGLVVHRRPRRHRRHRLVRRVVDHRHRAGRERVTVNGSHGPVERV